MIPPTFATAAECLAHTEAHVWDKGYTEASNDALKRHRAGERQQLCSACQRWRWCDERCNHFNQGFTR